MHTDAGHRKRVRDRFLAEGLDSFDPVHALELLLFYAIPQKDTKPLARALLDRFGSFPQVMEASREELMNVPGVGESVSAYLRLVAETGRYYQQQRDEQRVVLNTTQKCAEYLMKRFFGRRNETVFLLCLDAKCGLLNCVMVGEGDVNSASIPVRRMVELALGVNASAVVLAHNHPGGLPIPSGEDVETTNRVITALDSIGIVLADHIVVSGGEYVSMVQSGRIPRPNF